MAEFTIVKGPQGAPYSSAVVAGNIVFLAGTMGNDPESGKFADNIAEQADHCLRNLSSIAQQAGVKLSDIVSATVYLTNFERDFGTFNQVWMRYFPESPPTRATVEVSALAPSALIEIQAIAVV